MRHSTDLIPGTTDRKSHIYINECQAQMTKSHVQLIEQNTQLIEYLLSSSTDQVSHMQN